jgi:hypothetical protein
MNMQQVFRRMNGIRKVKELLKNRRHLGNVYNKFDLDYSQLIRAPRCTWVERKVTTVQN